MLEAMSITVLIWWMLACIEEGTVLVTHTDITMLRAIAEN